MMVVAAKASQRRGGREIELDDGIELGGVKLVEFGQANLGGIVRGCFIFKRDCVPRPGGGGGLPIGMASLVTCCISVTTTLAFLRGSSLRLALRLGYWLACRFLSQSLIMFTNMSTNQMLGVSRHFEATQG